MIGCPFYFSVAWDDCFITSDSVGTLYYYDAEEGYRLDWPYFEPWEGYFIYNADVVNHTLYIQPKETTVALAKGIRDGLLKDIGEAEWLIRLSAETDQAKDQDNFAGVRGNATNLWDHRDRPEPPPVGEYVSLYFDHPEWKFRPGRYAADVRAQGEEGYVWDLVLEACQRDEIDCPQREV